MELHQPEAPGAGDSAQARAASVLEKMEGSVKTSKIYLHKIIWASRGDDFRLLTSGQRIGGISFSYRHQEKIKKKGTSGNE